MEKGLSLILDMVPVIIRPKRSAAESMRVRRLKAGSGRDIGFAPYVLAIFLYVGRKIYEALEMKLGEMGILNLYACIGCPEVNDEYLTTNSADFHAHMGFVKVGEFHKCGYKFGRWYNMILMEKIIGKHGDRQASVTCYPQLF